MKKLATSSRGKTPKPTVIHLHTLDIVCAQALKAFKNHRLFFQSPKLEDLLHVSKLGKNEAWSGVGYMHIQLLQKCVIFENNLKII